MIIKQYATGSDLTLINVKYNYPRKNEKGKYDDGSIDIIYVDNITCEKKLEHIENPAGEYYIVQEGKRVDYNRLYCDMSDLEKVVVPYKDIKKDIAERLGCLNVYFDNIRNGQSRLNDKLHENVNIFYSDYNIEDYYRKLFDDNYTNTVIPINKCYLDIEVDIIDAAGDFVEMGECPLNVATLVNDIDETIYTLVLRDSNNPLVNEFENSDGFVQEVKELIMNEVGGKNNYDNIYNLTNFNIQVLFYDEEISLINDIFVIINNTKPDFVLAWNMAFDIPYLYHRIMALGYTPESIMCHTDFPTKQCKYHIDDTDQYGNRKEPHKRGDTYNISSYSVYEDQLIHFASRRAATNFTNYKLDHIGEVVANVRKLDFYHICSSMAKFPYTDFRLFVKYNIMDTIVQKCVEMKVNDIDYIFAKCIMNNTRYSKIHRQTVYLINSLSKSFMNDLDMVRGNNINKSNQKEPYPGAFVADPTLVTDYSRLKINDKPVNLYNNADDFDYKSLYPSVIEEFNIGPNTQVGMLKIGDEVDVKNENHFDRSYYSRSGSFLEDYHSRDILGLAYRWFNLPDYKDLYFKVVNYCKNVNDYNIYRYGVSGNKMLFSPVQQVETNEPVRIFEQRVTPADRSLFYLANNINIEEIVYNG